MKREIIYIMAFLIYSVAYANLNDSLVGHWAFDGNAYDTSGYGNHGMVEGAVLTADRFGNPDSAYWFDGVDDRILVGDYELATDNQLTVQAWFKTTSHVYYAHPLVSKLYNGVAYYLGGGVGTANKIKFLVNSTYDGGAYSDGNLNDDRWYHAVGVYDGSLPSGNIRLYINGIVQAVETDLHENIKNVSESISIGGNSPPATPNSGTPNPDFFNGFIDDVRIYNRALSADEVQQLYTIPEPASLLLLGLGGMLIRKR